MKLIVSVFLILSVSLAIAAPLDESNVAQIVKYENDILPNGGYKYSFETSDGVSRSEEAEIKNPGTENETLVIRGTISWTSPDGQQFTLEFIADENGFQPTGAHLPKE